MDNRHQQSKNDAFVVSRKLLVPGLRDETCAQTIRECLGEMTGVLDVKTYLINQRVRISYDAAQIGFNVIQEELTDSGYPLADNRWGRFKYAWYRYLDENAKANAESSGEACCSNPSDIYARRHK